jgi:hypothetical protein
MYYPIFEFGILGLLKIIFEIELSYMFLVKI